MNNEETQNKINELEIKIAELEKPTIISLREYHDLINGLEKYKEIKELKPIAEMIERQINKLNVWA